ncbi:MAG: M20/M25/M40 family metallo-hydrolase [Bacteroidales bacterium]|nr:M20/M25/M40 family metallo-hydrolase [Bacteroidales bacterium]
MKKINTIIILLFLSIIGFSQTEITSKEVQNHIDFLASDDLKGRFPGTEGDETAANYIRDEFKNLGLELLFDDGFQYFDIQTKSKVVGSKSLQIGSFSCKYVEEYQPLMFSASGKFSGKAVFAGYGMTIEDENQPWNDYENLDVKGKWVVIFRGKPNIAAYPETYFDKYTIEYSKVLTASDLGAVGVVFINGYNDYPKDKLIEPCFGRFSEKAQIPAYSVIRYTGDRLLGFAGKKVGEVEKLINETGKTVSFDLDVTIKNDLTIEPVMVKTHNVVAVLEGSDENLKDEYIVIGAHYDHLGFGGCNSGSKMPDKIAIHNGADDNASGVAGVLEIAEYLAANKNLLGRSIIFIAFGAEERGLLGSNYFVENLPVDKDKIYCMLNMDMIGKYNGKLTVMGAGTAAEFNDVFNSVDYDTTTLNVKLHDKPYSGSDHASFISHGIPAVFFYGSSGKDYHTPFDDAEFINSESAAIIMQYVANSAIKFSIKEGNLTFVDVKDENNNNNHGYGMRVKLGVVPAFEDTDNKGMKISGVTDDSPAQKGGMQANDIITAINDEPVSNIYDYMERLKKINPGDKTVIKINRGGEEIEIEIQF